jgi:1-acyl-sn-glycerol-3-phosphate acyltransferase
MIYFKLLLVSLWLVVSCTYGVILCLFRWGDLNLNKSFARVFSAGVNRILGLRLEFEGLELLEASQPVIYVANHQSGLDMSIFGALYPRRTVVVGKKELLYIPFFGLYFKAAGNIVINREKRVSAVAGLTGAVSSIHDKGVSVWIFPEGTRNRTSAALGPFKKGAFYMALQAKVPIVPVICEPLGELVNWKEKKLLSGRIRVKVLPAIDTSTYGPKDVERLSQDVHQIMLDGITVLAKVR